MLEDDYKLGFILCFSIAESLRTYETGLQTFEEAFPAIINHIDVAREKQWWDSFWTK
jgi:hypothetical protein